MGQFIAASAGITVGLYQFQKEGLKKLYSKEFSGGVSAIYPDILIPLSVNLLSIIVLEKLYALTPLYAIPLVLLDKVIIGFFTITSLVLLVLLLLLSLTVYSNL